MLSGFLYQYIEFLVLLEFAKMGAIAIYLPPKSDTELNTTISKTVWPELGSKCHKMYVVAKPWHALSTSQVVISSKMAPCIIQPASFNGHLNTH